MFRALILIAHGIAAIALWAMLPGGFPFLHARCFANRLLPALIAGSVLFAAMQTVRRSRSVLGLLLVYPAAWLGVAISARIIFPESGGGVALVAGAVTLFFSLGLAEDWSRQRDPLRGAWLTVPLGLVLGAGFILAQRAPESSTRTFATLPAPSIDVPAWRRAQFDVNGVVELRPWLRVEPESNRVTVQAGAIGIAVTPRLAFTSRSPDRFWTVFASGLNLPPLNANRGARKDSELLLQYPDEGSLCVEATPAEAVAIEAYTPLAAPVYSHLNSYTALSVTGHRRLGLRFSACPAQLIEVVHSEYPVGAPARLAYLDAHGMFRVVQADDAEKGPFTTLAEGSLARGEALSVELVELGDAARPTLATIVFRDWSQQLSTELSPTAGWGLPQNALEFGRVSNNSASQVYIDLTLAGTSVGRGWDSVGHVAGVYVNRMEIRLPRK